MNSGLKVGQRIEGKIGTYIISARIHKDVWTTVYTEPLCLNSCPFLTLAIARIQGKW